MIKATRYLFTWGLICCLITGFVLTDCASARGRDKGTSGTSQVARLGRSFSLKAGREVTLKGERLRIKFAAVESDSRCPADVTCIWAGNAAVRLELSRNGKDRKSLTLSTGRGAPFVGETLYHGYKVQLVGLNPYPRSTQPIAANNYVVTLMVTRE